MRVLSYFTLGLLGFYIPCSTVLADWETHLLPKNFQMTNSFSKAVALSKDTKKAVILYYTRTNCPPCDRLQSHLRNSEIADQFRDSYVFTAVWGSSMGRIEREDYRQRYGIQGAPTWVAFNAAGEYLCTSAGGFISVEEGKKLHEDIQRRLSTPMLSNSNQIEKCSAL